MKKKINISWLLLLICNCVQSEQNNFFQETIEPFNNWHQTEALKAVKVEVSAGELIDKLTILEIKIERIQDPYKMENIQNELRAVIDTVQTYIPPSKELNKLKSDLKETNKKLWDIEDQIRDKEQKKEFDQEFIDISRSVYITNDERGRIKREINQLLGSRLIEEKAYTEYE